MGFKTWLMNRFLKKELNKLKKGDNEAVADELLKRTLAQYTDAIKTAQKINKANILDLKTKQLKKELKDSLTDDDEEDDEEDDDELTQIFTKTILPKLINPNPNLNPENLKKISSTLTPEQQKAIFEKLGL